MAAVPGNKWLMKQMINNLWTAAYMILIEKSINIAITSFGIRQWQKGHQKDPIAVV